MFVIEVILIKNTEMRYSNDDSKKDCDWTISCTYDQKVTRIKLIIYNGHLN